MTLNIIIKAIKYNADADEVDDVDDNDDVDIGVNY